MQIELKNTTFIIPIRIEHPDRYRNAQTTLGFLNKHFKTNVFIYETSDTGTTKLDFLPSLTDLDIKHWVINDEETFHRTKYLNIMLDSVTTPVCVNYDIDVILSPGNYIECERKLVSNECDVIYPYELGMGQKMVEGSLNLNEFYDSEFDIGYIDSLSSAFTIFHAECGHCVFFNTEVYKKNGGENENFLSYGPEDKERRERFTRLGFRVEWKPEHYVYHFEHHRGNDSSQLNPHFNHNWDVYNNLNRLADVDLNEYIRFYKNPNYAAGYNTIGEKNNE